MPWHITPKRMVTLSFDVPQIPPPPLAEKKTLRTAIDESLMQNGLSYILPEWRSSENLVKCKKIWEMNKETSLDKLWD